MEQIATIGSQHSVAKLYLARKILTILPHIDGICAKITNANQARAQTSYQVPYESYMRYDTEQLVEMIIEKTYRKWELENLQARVKKQLSYMPKKYSEIVEMYFIKHIPPIVIAKDLKVSERTVFNNINKSVEWLAGRFDLLNLTESVCKFVLEYSI